MDKHLILTFIHERELPQPKVEGVPWMKRFLDKVRPGADRRADYLSVFTALSAKFKGYPGALIDAAGCERHAWEYLVFKNKEEAEREGKRLGLLCAKHKIRVFWANAEAGVAGTKPYAKIEMPYVNLLAFIKAFRAAAPTYTKLGYNGFSWARTSDGRRLHDAEMMRLFDFWCPMNYGITGGGVEDHWLSKCFKYRKTNPALPVVPMIGVGRVDAQGNVWGHWPTHKRLLLSRPEVQGVNWFFGNGASPQMLVGNPSHPPLVQCAAELREAWG